MNNINILPIFNQAAPGIWDDFMRIRSAAMEEVYNYTLGEKDFDVGLEEFYFHWNNTPCVFAFGAYDGDKMVGCINGHAKNRIAEVSHLYVMPEYHNKRIGRRLLTAAESAMSINAQFIKLDALTKAYKFYQHMGYTSPANTSEFIKPIKDAGKCSATPVFFCNKKLAEKCTDIITQNNSDFKFSQNHINKTHKPLFVYRDINQEIKAFSIADENLTTFANKPDPDNWVKQTIERKAFDFWLRTKDKSK